MKTTMAILIGAALMCPGFAGMAATGEKGPVLPDLLRPRLESLSLSRTTILGGFPTVGTVRLSKASGSSGAFVSISTNDPIATSVPSFITVPSGKIATRFTIGTAHVDAPHLVTLTATLGTTSKTSQLTVMP